MNDELERIKYGPDLWATHFDSGWFVFHTKNGILTPEGLTKTRAIAFMKEYAKGL